MQSMTAVTEYSSGPQLTLINEFIYFLMSALYEIYEV